MSRCPSCGRTVQQVLGGSRAPAGDDIMICVGCGAICYFTPALQLRLLRPEDQRRFNATLLLEAIAISDAIMRDAGSTEH